MAFSPFWQVFSDPIYHKTLLMLIYICNDLKMVPPSLCGTVAMAQKCTI